MLFHDLVSVDRLEKSSITVWGKHHLWRALHNDLAFSTYSWQRRLLEEHKRVLMTSKEIVLVEEFNCLCMVNRARHNHELAFLDIFRKLFSIVCFHLRPKESLSEYLEDTLAARKANIKHALWVLKSKSW